MRRLGLVAPCDKINGIGDRSPVDGHLFHWVFKTFFSLKPLVNGCGLALASAYFLSLALRTPDGMGFLALIAATLLPCALILVNSRVWATLVGWVFGVSLMAFSFPFLFDINGFHWYHGTILFGVLGLGYALFGCLSWSDKSDETWPLKLACVWIVTMWIRHHLGFLSFPWASFSQTQTSPVMLAITSVGGEYLLDGCLIFIGGSVVTSLYRLNQDSFSQVVWGLSKRALLVAMLILTVNGYQHGVGQASADKTLRIAVIQPNFRIGQFDSELNQVEAMAKLRKLSHAAVAQGAQLLVWPESATNNLPNSMLWLGFAYGLTDELNVPIVTGSTYGEKLGTHRTANQKNTVYLLKPQTRLSAAYEKINLLPFAEYLPLSDWVNWPSWLIPKMFDIQPGSRLMVMKVSGTAFHPLICWENVFSDLVRAMAVQEKVQFLTHHVNDNWFGNSAGPWMHNNISRIRAAEMGIPIAVASNSGPSSVYDQHGNLVASTGTAFRPGMAVGAIQLTSTRSVYAKLGDLPLFVIVLLVVFWLSRVRRAPT